MERANPFTVTLTTDDRADLEALRIHFGLKSSADVVRHLIRRAARSEDREAATVQVKGAGLMRRAMAEAKPKIESAVKEAVREMAAEISLGPVTPAPGSRLKKK